MNIHIHKKDAETQIATDAGACKSHALVATLVNGQVITNHCTRIIGNLPDHLVILMGYDPKFEGRKQYHEGEDSLMPAPCIGCLARLCGELKKSQLGLPSNVYE